MTRILVGCALLAMAGPASAGRVALMGAGGRESPVLNSWTGLDLVLQPSRTEGWELAGRLTPTYAFSDATPMLITEVGALRMLKSVDEARVRVGLLGRFLSFVGDIPMPIQPGGRPFHDQRKLGFVPGFMAVVDFEWGDERPYAIGLKGGPGAMAVDTGCADLPDTVDPRLCMSWATGFMGGFTMRARSARGLTFESTIGPSLSVGVGYAFGGKD